ncbi:MAG: TetR/AcrR family transcriptional regulator C-terminal domain-containing protein [Clostridiales bacterium]|nr:TetR/AcrR family transcriptional regulator C-terminal domain-containing protein [Candidatus Coliplasma caballi]
MQQLTKQAVSDAFFRIAAVRSPEKITVRDIVEECGVTRNTFYYYFRDVYDVIEDAFLSIAAGIEEQTDPAEHLSDTLFGFADFLYDKRAAMRNICSAIGKDAVKQDLSRALDSVLLDALKNRAREYPGVKEEDLLLIAACFREAMLGILLDWLQSNDKEHPRRLLVRFGELWNGTVPILLSNAAHSEKKERN